MDRRGSVPGLAAIIGWTSTAWPGSACTGMATAPVPEWRRACFLDTVVLRNFALAGRLDLLAAHFGQRGCLMHQVTDELSEGIAAGYPGLSAV